MIRRAKSNNEAEMKKKKKETDQHSKRKIFLVIKFLKLLTIHLAIENLKIYVI